MRDMSLGGIFIETDKPKAVGIKAEVHFLVREGQIRADAVVRRSIPGTGLELKSLEVSEQDRPKLAALMSRLRSLSHSAANHKLTETKPS